MKIYKEIADSIYAISPQMSINDRRREGNALYGIGLTLQVRNDKDDLDVALKNYQAAQKIYQKIGDKKGEQNAFNSIAFVKAIIPP